MATPVYPLTTTTSLLVNTLTNRKIVFLPAASTIQSGKLYFIKDICGNAGVSSIFVSTTGQDQLDGRNFRSTNYGLLSTNFQSVLLASDGFLNWMILQNYNANVIGRGIRGGVIATGGTIVSAGGITYHVFTTTGTFTVSAVASGATANYLIVGGGGGGGDRHGGGGGAGGVLGGTFSPTVQSYTITVGSGGAAGNYEGGVYSPTGSGQKGGDSSIAGVATAFGGGGGGTYDGNPSGTFGSGGGGGGNNLAGVGGTAGQGNAGGAGLNPGGGGGGGAGGVGSAANTSTGGIGSAAYSTHLLAVGYGTTFATSPQSPISGGIAYIGGGGGGAANSSTAPTARAGGLGGGGTGDWDDAVITAGTANTGGGGGASRSNTVSTTGRNGGSGLVLIWYS